MGGETGLDLLYVGMLPPHPGGSGISWAQLLSGFAARGHRIRCVSPVTAEGLNAGDIFSRDHPELNVHRFQVRHHYTGPNVPASDDYIEHESRCIRELLPQLIAQRRPDLLIVGRETFGLHVPELASHFRIPVVQGIRGNTTVAILNGTYPKAHGERLLAQFRKATLLVSAASHMADGLRRLGFHNVEVIPNAVDPDQFAPHQAPAVLPAELTLWRDDIVVAHISNLKAAKRPMDLVGAARLALHHNVRLLFAVIGDGAFRMAMENECERLDILHRFCFPGWVDHSLIPAFLQRADMVVSMSETEGLSRVYLETQAAARLLIASDIAPAREVISDGVTGLLFRLGDVEDLADKILWAALHPHARKTIGTRARAQAERWPLREAVKAYLGAFTRCIEQYQPLAK